MKLLICAGGTGGHIYPALAAASALQNLGVRRQDILWIGTRNNIEAELAPRAGFRLETLRGGAVVSSAPLHRRIVNGMQLIGSIGAAARHIRQFRPDVMLMTGGYTAVPVTLAAWLRRVPGIIYLPDVEPGATIRLLQRFVQTIACTAEESRQFLPADKLVVTGYPVRPELRAANRLTKAEALAHFDLAPGRPTLFVFGGSRGAQNINRALMGVLPELLRTVQVIHISGTFTWPEVEANAAALEEKLRAWYRPYPYLHTRMGAAFRAADLALARAGASMLGECPAFGLPAILVPLTFAWRYQKVNADYLTARGAAVQSSDERLPAELLPTVQALLHDANRLAAMRAAAKALDTPDAARRLAEVILALGKRATA